MVCSPRFTFSSIGQEQVFGLLVLLFGFCCFCLSVLMVAGLIELSNNDYFSTASLQRCEKDNFTFVKARKTFTFISQDMSELIKQIRGRVCQRREIYSGVTSSMVRRSKKDPRSY